MLQKIIRLLACCKKLYVCWRSVIRLRVTDFERFFSFAGEVLYICWRFTFAGEVLLHLLAFYVCWRYTPPPPMIFVFFFFFCLSAQRSVMSMMIIPLPHYDNIFEKKIWSRKKCVGVPPPPPPPGAAVARHFTPTKQTPWRRPCITVSHIHINRSNCMNCWTPPLRVVTRGQDGSKFF